MTFWPSLRRLARITFVIIRHLIAHACGLVLVSLSLRPKVRISGPERLRVALEELGGSFIKFGQLLALQPDIVSLEYCNELFNLLDRIEPFPFEHVEQVFRDELGKPTSELFDEFTAEPMATASIGQVHAAVLGGRRVAVKVQRPSVDADFMGDIRLIAFAIGAIRRLQIRSLFWVLEPMDEFVAWTREELDYRREARYADRLRRNAEHNPFERVPEVFWDLTTRRTLVMEYMSGVTVLDYLRAQASGDAWTPQRLRASGFSAARFARHIIDNFLGDA